MTPLVVSICRASILVPFLAGTAVSPAAGAEESVSCNGAAATLVGTSGRDSLVGTPGRDVIAGLSGVDHISGLGGDDLLCGGPDADTLIGGEGDDVLRGGGDSHLSDRGGRYSIGDLIVGGPGNDALDGGYDVDPSEDWAQLDRLSYAEAPAGVAIDLIAGVAHGEGDDSISSQRWHVLGSAHDDVIQGGPLDDEIAAGGGTDVVMGAGGNDDLSVDDRPSDGAGDEVDGGEGSDSISSSGGSDLLDGGPDGDFLYTQGGGADDVAGGDGGDALYAAGRSADVITGGEGDDVIHDVIVAGGGQSLEGGVGRDSIWLDTWFRFNGERQTPPGIVDLPEAQLTVDWEPQATQVHVTSVDTVTVPGGWTIMGTGAPENLRSGGGPVTIHAGGGDDRLAGGPFADLLDGGEGHDTATPRLGLDTCTSIEATPHLWNLCDPSPVNEVIVRGDLRRTGYRPSISRDGRYAAFETKASLVPGDTNGVSDVYVRDSETDRTFRVSVRSDGAEIPRGGYSGSISPDGRHVAFLSRGWVVPRAAAGPQRVYLRDLDNKTTRLVSIGNEGIQDDGFSWAPSVSSGGTRVAFISSATNLGDGSAGVFVRDLSLGRTLHVSVSSQGRPAGSDSDAPRITPDGRYVLFYSHDASTLANVRQSGFVVRDIRRGRTSWVAEGTSYYEDGSISDDGRFVAFTARPDTCLPRWRTDCLIIRVVDRRSATTETLPATEDGAAPDDASMWPSLSGDGRFLAFTSRATNLVADDHNMVADVFVLDRETDRITRASLGPALVEANGASGVTSSAEVPAALMSGNGRWLLYTSKATNLVENGADDLPGLYLRDWDRGLFG